MEKQKELEKILADLIDEGYEAVEDVLEFLIEHLTEEQISAIKEVMMEQHSDYFDN